MRRGIVAGAAVVALASIAADVASIAPFSGMAAGAVRAPWRELRIANTPAAQIAVVDDAGTFVLRVRSQSAAGSAAHALAVDPVGHALAWRWKVDRVVDGADLMRRQGDDFAARVYVFYDLPRSELPLATRAKLAIVELLYGEKLPTAAICYVWDNRHPVGTSAWNPYASTVRTVVLRSGNGQAGRWQDERRDLAADFRAAFGRSEVPRVTGIAAGNDTDQTGETANAWFGDFRLEAHR